MTRLLNFQTKENENPYQNIMKYLFPSYVHIDADPDQIVLETTNYITVQYIDNKSSKKLILDMIKIQKVNYFKCTSGFTFIEEFKRDIKTSDSTNVNFEDIDKFQVYVQGTDPVKGH